MKKRTLSAAVLAGAILASSTSGMASALEEDTTKLAGGASSTFNASDEINQTDAKPQMKKVDAQVDKVKTIDLDEKDVNVLGASWEGDNSESDTRQTMDGQDGKNYPKMTKEAQTSIPTKESKPSLLRRESWRSKNHRRTI